MPRSFRLLTPALALTLVGLAGPAFADPSDLASAQALFDDGVRLMKANKFSEGCPKLAESYRLDPAGGTIVALALCHEGEGKTATAWAEFNAAQTQARNDHRKDRETAATDHIKALEPKLTRVRIVVEPESDVEGLEIKRNGSAIGKAQWRTALPVDPADYTFEASAPGRVSSKQLVTVKGEGATTDVKIPVLAMAPVVATTDPVIVPPKKEEPPPPPPPKGNPYLVYAAIAGTVGVLSTGAGVIFGVRAKSLWNGVEGKCPNNVCTSDGDRSDGKKAGTSADLSTAFFIIGGVGIAGAAVLFFTGQAAKSSALRVTPMVGPTVGGLMLGGAL